MIGGVNKSLDTDLTNGPLATLAPSVTPTTANTFQTSVWQTVLSYETQAAAQLAPRFGFVNGQIFNHAQSILDGVIFHTGQFQLGNETRDPVLPERVVALYTLIVRS